MCRATGGPRPASSDRKRLEQLLRYCARPPISHDRLHALGDGRLALELGTAWFDGTTHLLLQPDELLQRLVAIIPRPHKNLVVYHGVLAPNARWRRDVVTYGRPTKPLRRSGATESPAS